MGTRRMPHHDQRMVQRIHVPSGGRQEIRFRQTAEALRAETRNGDAGRPALRRGRLKRQKLNQSQYETGTGLQQQTCPGFSLLSVILKDSKGGTK